MLIWTSSSWRPFCNRWCHWMSVRN